ncbi:photosystem I reaction center subunit PsaK [Prochlorothrix hollandica]|uniref:Photosystem I reaction center subunit PsaK n=1 Tax=Prochlorothrix hollandica PCC 9006 = CALU 1027 TaxID=317619 RepID=A0A0M2PZ61_PROHO|nr:photosystem I reaction center subunit PsaK [Prochlorothrix hollandica]KKJ00343.1 photosystem I reaction center subunit X [Prochlorothrix hollandica PCC 9006 = CALU 1027]
MIFTLLAAVPTTVAWSPKVAAVMIACNVLAIAFGKLSIEVPDAPPATPAPSMFGGFGIPAVIATTCFGHILGAGAILGLSSLGAL